MGQKFNNALATILGENLKFNFILQTAKTFYDKWLNISL